MGLKEKRMLVIGRAGLIGLYLDPKERGIAEH
jgi:hypothetical protein